MSIQYLTKEQWDAGQYGRYVDLEHRLILTRYQGYLGPHVSIDCIEEPEEYSLFGSFWLFIQFVLSIIGILLIFSFVILSLVIGIGLATFS